MGIFLIIFFCINIVFRAKMRGLNALPWVVYTILAVFGGVFAAMIVIAISWVTQFGSSPEQLEKMQSMIKSGELVPSNLNEWFILVCAFGGYLLVRYRIEKHPKLDGNDKDGSPPQ